MTKPVKFIETPRADNDAKQTLRASSLQHALMDRRRLQNTTSSLSLTSGTFCACPDSSCLKLGKRQAFSNCGMHPIFLPIGLSPSKSFLQFGLGQPIASPCPLLLLTLKLSISRTVGASLHSQTVVPTRRAGPSWYLVLWSCSAPHMAYDSHRSYYITCSRESNPKFCLERSSQIPSTRSDALCTTCVALLGCC